MSNWQLPPTFIQEYLDACKLAATDDKAFAEFRNNDRINTIIENTPQEWADKALKAMDYTPTMIRYIYTFRLMKRLFRPWSFSGKNIVEIGAGYGGQCRIIVEFAPPRQYAIFDLPEVKELQTKYLLKHNIGGYFPDIKDFDWANLCISWCAWSELSRELREEYAEKVISKCDHFFICSNYNKEEDKEILSKYFPNIKEYSDDLVENVIYA